MCGPDQQNTRAHVLRELDELARNTHDLKAAQALYEEAVVLFSAETGLVPWVYRRSPLFGADERLGE
jgi:hypothetical protein